MAAFRPSKLPRATTLPPRAELFDDKSNSTMPRAGALTAVEYHQQWLESYAAAAAADVGSQHATLPRLLVKDFERTPNAELLMARFEEDFLHARRRERSSRSGRNEQDPKGVEPMLVSLGSDF